MKNDLANTETGAPSASSGESGRKLVRAGRELWASSGRAWVRARGQLGTGASSGRAGLGLVASSGRAWGKRVAQLGPSSGHMGGLEDTTGEEKT